MTYQGHLPGGSQQSFPGQAQAPNPHGRYQGTGYMPGTHLPSPHLPQPQFAPIHQQQFYQQTNGHPMQQPHAQYPANAQAFAYNGAMNDPRAHALPPPQPPMQYAPQQQPQHHYPQQSQYSQPHFQPQQQQRPQHMVSPVPAYVPSPTFQQHQQPPRASPQTHAQPLAQPPQQTHARQSPMPPPTVRHSTNSPRISTASNSPRVSQKPKPRVSTDGAIQKPTSTQRKPSTSAAVQSPRPATKVLVDSPSVLVCAADEFFEKAHAAVQQVAGSLAPALVAEYQKLVATGLACLQAALVSQKLSPRAEVITRLRYGAILGEETENLMEAETSLNMAVQLCEKHRFADLKMYAEFISTKVLYRWKSKAAQIALDGHINDCVTYKNVYWIYALRFLKASFNLQSANPVDAHATDNLKHINTLAKERGDRVIEVIVALLDGVTHLKTMRQGALVRVRACIAAASKYQLDDSIQVPQLEILTRLLDLGCTLQEKAPTEIQTKMQSMQARLDELRDSPMWKNEGADMLLPLKKHAVSSQSISQDTSAVLSPGDEACDHLVLSSLNMVESWVLAYTMSGLAFLYKQGSDKSLPMWEESLKMLAAFEKMPMSRRLSLNEATKQANWRIGAVAYVNIMMALTAATHSEWQKVKECLDKLEQLPKDTLTRNLEILILYVQGTYKQGVGELDDAKSTFENPLFKIQDIPATSDVGRQVEHQVSILAGLNRVWIMQANPDKASLSKSTALASLVEQLSAVCENHVDLEIKTAYHLVIAPLRNELSLGMKQVKTHIQAGLQGGKETSNTQCLAIALNVMRYCLFENVVGEQAIKSARAGASQAKKSGNLLWMSVGEGMLAESFELQGLKADAAKAREAGTLYANQSYDRTQ